MCAARRLQAETKKTLISILGATQAREAKAVASQLSSFHTQI